MTLIDEITKHFESKHREFSPFLFYEAMINEDSPGYFLKEAKYSEKVQKLPSDCDFHLIRATFHLCAWIMLKRPIIHAEVNILSKVTIEIYQKSHMKMINVLIKHAKNNPWSGLICRYR